YSVFIFFFQAEDGIQDFHVTGVQTCALPILLAALIAEREDWHLRTDPGARALPGFRTELRDLLTRATELGISPARLAELGREQEIGRARVGKECRSGTAAEQHTTLI